MKIITLSTKQAKSLKELMDRGLAYTDLYYTCFKRMSNIYDLITKQLQNNH